MRLRLLSALFLAPILAQAQVANYSFSDSTGTYTAITGGTEEGSELTDDGLFEDLPIGFTYRFNGRDFTRFSISSNGYLVLGSTAGSTGVDYAVVSGSDHSGLILSPTSLSEDTNIIAGFNVDLQGQAGSQLSHTVQGTAPNRRLIVQWSNFREYGETDEIINFQIHLLETSNAAVFAYGTMRLNNDGLRKAQVGLRSTLADVYGLAGTWDAPSPATAVNLGLAVDSANRPEPGTYFIFRSGGVASAAPRVQANLQAYPNPSAGMLTLKGLPTALQGKTAIVSDLTGRQVARLPLTRQLNLSQLEPGTYVLSAEGVRMRFAISR